jgi:hypothetical protein
MSFDHLRCSAQPLNLQPGDATMSERNEDRFAALFDAHGTTRRDFIARTASLPVAASAGRRLEQGGREMNGSDTAETP